MKQNNRERKEEEIKKLFEAQKIVLYCLLVLIYLSFIGLQLGRIQTITDFNYNLHEMMYLPFNIAIFVVPALSLIYVFLFVKYISKRGRKKSDLKTIIKTVVTISSIVIIVMITEHQFQEVSTSGVFIVEQKRYDNGKYYLITNNKKVRVSHNEFELVEENQQYLINYIWNKRTSDIGRLETIQRIE
ncbi:MULTISPECIES: hypothetical protein [Lysinibacillus]|uniref:Uncharacterized protein n=1 Tax=Lysinibacillus antri TaxID=2498145 RepID=A0A432L6R6_9BACI|nr:MULTISPECIES: hypothetical protein [Lysinibacillus]RUL45644.1 hypothetical protein EK386_19445 [Lysinibacillus antri]TSI03898.1 hypothetical protein FJQ64_15490 [Lysinibacillus sp. BW-2-10]